MGTNPALSLKTISSHPGMDHAANFYLIMQTARGMWTSSAHLGSTDLAPSGPQPAPSGFQPTPPSSRPETLSSQLPQMGHAPSAEGHQFGYSPGAECLQYHQPFDDQSSPGTEHPQYHQHSGSQSFQGTEHLQDHQPSGGQSSPGTECPQYHQPSGGQSSPGTECPQYHQPSQGTYPPYSSGSQSYHQPYGGQSSQGVYPHPSHPGAFPNYPHAPPPSESQPYHDNNDYASGHGHPTAAAPCAELLGGAWCHESQQPPKPGTKCRLRQSSPSLSPSPPPQPAFALPLKSQASDHNSHAAFDTSTRHKPSSSKSSHSRTTSMLLAPVSMSPTSLSFSKGKWRQAKKPWSDLQDNLDKLNDDIESIQLDCVTREELKNEHHMVKYNLARQVNEHRFMCEQHTHNDREATAAHQRSQEAKDKDIRLCEAEEKAHVASANAHAEEVATLRLKIELCRLSNSS
ncbi:hypothetical protein DFH29DRAFT_1003486 [Suillus ampliporus]|nr:hypothetical protein DFH29DRAFT_1003486 [Suillus ampliporus]